MYADVVSADDAVMISGLAVAQVQLFGLLHLYLAD